MNASLIINEFILLNKYIFNKCVLFIMLFFAKRKLDKVPDSEMLKRKMLFIEDRYSQLKKPIFKFNWAVIYPAIIVFVSGFVFVVFISKGKTNAALKLDNKVAIYEDGAGDFKEYAEGSKIQNVILSEKKLSDQQKSDRRQEINTAFSNAEREIRVAKIRLDSKAIDITKFYDECKSIIDRAQSSINGPNFIDYEIDENSKIDISGAKIESIVIEKSSNDGVELHMYGYVVAGSESKIKSVDIIMYDKYGKVMPGRYMGQYETNGNEVYTLWSDNSKRRNISTYGKIKSMSSNELAFDIKFKTCGDAIRASKIIVKSIR